MIGLIAYGAKRTTVAVFALFVHVFLWVPVTLVGRFLFTTSRYVTGTRLLTQESIVQMSPTSPNSKYSGDPTGQVVLIGGGFTGLAAAYVLTRQGVQVTLLERDDHLGGLAGSFEVNGERLEKFYHHWFTNDEHVMQLVKELHAEDCILYRPTRTGMYYANNFFKLSSPLDVLRFTPLNWIDRLRLGLLVLRARRVKDWQQLEARTAEEWLLELCGREVYRVVWEPLLRGKFGPFASDISAVWFWNKVKLRGGSRSKDGGEVLAYYKGGFAALAERITEAITSMGGQIQTGTAAAALVVDEGRVTGVQTGSGIIRADAVIATPALPLIADLVEPHATGDYTRSLRQIDYLANVCLVLELDRSLSSTYWLNVNDPDFPFVGVIEHTNFEPSTTYGGRHIVYLSKYLPDTADLYQMSSPEALAFSIPHLQRMFPDFRPEWILAHHFWRAQYSQPIVVRHYSDRIPSQETPIDGFYIATMAQIYPEDRGTNYAIRQGKAIGNLVAAKLSQAKQLARSF